VGIRIAGFLNYVRNHSTGIEIAGAFNLTGNNFKGFQLSGIGNSVGGFTEGVQIASLYNISRLSMAGMQISGMFNYTKGFLAGTQVSMINKAGLVGGKKTRPLTRARGLQIGLINFSTRMDGIQIGLINFGGDAHGTQIGLLNFFSTAPSEQYDVTRGTPIGLLNFGPKGSYVRISYNELFAANLEYSTGNCVNCSGVPISDMPIEDHNRKFNQNVLIAGYSPQQSTWGFGYGFQRVLYNKVFVRPSIHNEKRMINYGIKLMHLNKSMSFDHSFNLLNRFNLDYGKRMGKIYVFASASLNYFVYEPTQADAYTINSLKVASGKLGNMNTSIWPGYTIGVQLTSPPVGTM
jgi:hypothetical protein